MGTLPVPIKCVYEPCFCAPPSNRLPKRNWVGSHSCHYELRITNTATANSQRRFRSPRKPLAADDVLRTAPRFDRPYGEATRDAENLAVRPLRTVAPRAAAWNNQRSSRPTRYKLRPRATPRTSTHRLVNTSTNVSACDSQVDSHAGGTWQTAADIMVAGGAALRLRQRPADAGRLPTSRLLVNWPAATAFAPKHPGAVRICRHFCRRTAENRGAARPLPPATRPHGSAAGEPRERKRISRLIGSGRLCAPNGSRRALGCPVATHVAECRTCRAEVAPHPTWRRCPRQRGQHEAHLHVSRQHQPVPRRLRPPIPASSPADVWQNRHSRLDTPPPSLARGSAAHPGRCSSAGQTVSSVLR